MKPSVHVRIAGIVVDEACTGFRDWDATLVAELLAGHLRGEPSPPGTDALTARVSHALAHAVNRRVPGALATPARHAGIASTAADHPVRNRRA